MKPPLMTPTDRRDALSAALDWIRRGFRPLPVKPRSKKAYNPDHPEGKEWQTLRVTEETAQKYFKDDSLNIGVLLGDDYGSADVDLDSLEAVRLAPSFLPDTGMKFGRASKRVSHCFYRVDPPIPSATFKDPTDRKVLLELRCRNKDGSVGHQTVVPPSIHESGEPIQFEPGFDAHPANVEAEPFLVSVKTLAGAALLARHWPEAGHGRHETMLALAGALQRGLWTEERAALFCLALYRAVPDHDAGAIARTEHEVRDTFRNAATGRATTGLPSLRQHFDERVVRQVLVWLQGAADEERRPSTDLILGERGSPRPLLANAVTLLRSHPAWRGVLAFDEFRQSLTAVKPTPWGYEGRWTDNEDGVATDWLQRHSGLYLKTHIVAEAVQLVGREASFDPVRHYLDSLAWDGTQRIASWLSLYLGAESSAFTMAVAERWLISAVARVCQPGCKADCVLILEGSQGLGKSRALAILGAPWFTDEIAEVGSKDSAMQLLGVWIVEIAELDSMTRPEVSRVKAFLSRSCDHFRPPYGRRVVEQPRRCVFAGTVNGTEYLRDETGNRRFWPVACSVARLEELQRDRDQIWAEAMHLYKQGSPWWFEEATLIGQAECEQAERLHRDPWHAVIENFISGRQDVSTTEDRKSVV